MFCLTPDVALATNVTLELVWQELVYTMTLPANPANLNKLQVASMQYLQDSDHRVPNNTALLIALSFDHHLIPCVSCAALAVFMLLAFRTLSLAWPFCQCLPPWPSAHRCVYFLCTSYIEHSILPGLTDLRPANV
jgi:hypothetical protein